MKKLLICLALVPLHTLCSEKEHKQQTELKFDAEATNDLWDSLLEKDGQGRPKHNLQGAKNALAAGADVNDERETRGTILTYLVDQVVNQNSQKALPILKLVLKQPNLDINKKSNLHNGKTALKTILNGDIEDSKNQMDTALLLIRHGADITWDNDRWGTHQTSIAPFEKLWEAREAYKKPKKDSPCAIQ